MSAARIQSLSGVQLRDLFAAATAWLERNVSQVNAVNVFPVPDGDTGTNMYLTMRSTMEEARRCDDPSVGAILAAMSHGALMGARGNSGVILSQIIGGLACGVDGAETVSAEAFASGLEEASQAAYKAVTKPAEGTILTVIRDVSEAAGTARSGDVTALLEMAVREAKASVERTPSLLPVLAEAGVVDAGGLGLSVLFEGMLRRLRGDEMAEVVSAGAETVEQDWLAATGALHQTQDSLYGYCTEVLIGGSGLDVESIRGRVVQLGDSVIVVGDPALVRVHVHTDDPGAVLSLGTEAGQLIQVKVDNIRRQAERFVEMHEQIQDGRGEPPSLSTVAVVAGEGIARVFADIGCTRTVSGGPTMNPSTREIIEAVDSCPSDDVAVLPNDKNIILAAQQARDLTEKRLHVIPTRSMPQGLAALLAINPSEPDLAAIVKAMEEACISLRTIEITRAVRSTSVRGVRVKAGDVIAIVDDELTLAAPSPEEALLQALEGLEGEGSLVTLYYGADTQADTADQLARNIRRRFSSYEVEVVFGGQPHYHYIASVE